MSGCLTDDVLFAFAVGRLPAEQRTDVYRHAEQCHFCQETLRGLGEPTHRDLEVGTAPTTMGLTGSEIAQVSLWSPPISFDEFHLLKPLGRGGMGQVHLAHDRVLARLVAIKFIDMETPDPQARERFLVEARAIARLSHPNIVSVYRFGEVEGRPYLVSEYVRGKSLDQLTLPVPLEQTRNLAIELTRGLRAAHRRGVLHRDIKPSNAIVDAEGHVKLLDFGLAKLLDPTPTAAPDSAAEGPPPAGPDSFTSAQLSPAPQPLTGAGAAMGTPMYMAPEAWRGEPASPLSDLYSLGAVIYELCSGRRPYQVDTLAELRRAVSDTDAPPLATCAAGLSAAPEFTAAVDRCLRRAPLERFASAEELLLALETADAAPAPQHRRPLRARSAGTALWGLAIFSCFAATAWVAEHTHRHQPAAEAVAIPGGEFRMGSTPTEVEAAYAGCQRQTRDPQRDCVLRIFQREQPARQVRLSPYRIDATEVTVERFATWLNQLSGLRIDPDREHPDLLRWVRDRDTLLLDLYPSFTPTFGLMHQGGRFEVLPGFEHKPVTHVTWDGAQRYCQWRGMRLPTEAEWEHAARPEEGFRFPWGYDEPRCDGVVFDRRQGGACVYLGLALPDVGTSLQDRTPVGVADLGGSVSEWVLDRFEERYRPCEPFCQDPMVAAPPVPAVERVMRGGEWNGMAVLARSAGRGRYAQDRCAQNLGFRCAAVPGPR